MPLGFKTLLKKFYIKAHNFRDKKSTGDKKETKKSTGDWKE